MHDFLASHAKEIGSFIGGLIAGGAGGCLITLRVTRLIQQSDSSVNQSKANAGGDIVGRDKISSDRR